MKVLENGMFVDRVVLLTLRRRADRRKAFLSQYRKLKKKGLWPFPEVEILYGVDGVRTGAPRDRPGSDGGWGCRQSHVRAWEDALSDDIERVFVFEDDASLEMMLDERREEFFHFLEQVPEDWGMVNIGYVAPGGRPLHVDGTDAVFTPGSGTILNNQAYLVNRPAMSKLYRDFYSPDHPDTFRSEDDDSIDYRIDQIRRNGGITIYHPMASLYDQDRRLESDNPWAILK